MAEICRRYRIAELAVSGSAARVDLRPGSDIDFYLEFEAGTHPEMGFFDLDDELPALFGKPVELGRKSLLKPLVRRNAVRDVVVRYTA
ncbi:MAG TPA: nucleotidyltransferase domain-containing protein [Paludibaculum sp.]